MTRWLMLEVCFLIFVLVGGPNGSRCELQDVNPFETPELSELLGDIKETLDDGIGPGLVREATLTQYSEEDKPRLVQTRSSPGKPSNLTDWDEADPVEPWANDQSPEQASNEPSFLGEDQTHNVKTEKRSVTPSEPDADPDYRDITLKRKDPKTQDKTYLQGLQTLSKPSGTGLLHKDSHLIHTSTPHPIAPMAGSPAGPHSAPAPQPGVSQPPLDQDDLWEGLQPESLTTLRHSAANPDQRAWLDKYHLKERWRINAAKNRRTKTHERNAQDEHHQSDREQHSNWHDTEVKDQLDSFLRKIKHRTDKDEDSMVYFRSFVSEKEGVLSDAARKLQELPLNPNLKLTPAVQ